MTDEPLDQDAILEGLWGRVTEAWDDDKTHGAVLEYALRSEQLPEIAGRYRALLDDPEKGAKAKKRIDAIVVAATQLMMATKSEPRKKTPGWVTGSAALVVLLLMSLLTYALAFKR
jgi:hypothetical protein